MQLYLDTTIRYLHYLGGCVVAFVLSLMTGTQGLTNYFTFYNEECPHQSLGYRTPSVVHMTGQGGSAIVQERFSKEESGQRGPATCDTRALA